MMILRRSRLDSLTVLASAAVITGIVARWYRLGSASLWFDEGYTAWAVSLPVARLFKVIQVDTAPPLHYLLLRGWTLLLGRSEATLRALSAVCATLSLLLLIPVAKRLLNDRRATAVAVSLYALGYLQITYSHEARLYTLMTLLAVAALWAVLRAIDRPGAWSTLTVALIWAAGLYTNNLMVLYVSAIALAWLILPGKTPLWQRVVNLVIAAAITLMLFWPWIPSMVRQARAVQGSFWMERPTAWSLQRTLAVLSGINEQGVDPLTPTSLGWVTAIVAVATIATLTHRRTWRTSVALTGIGLGPIVAVFVLSRIGKPIFVERAFLASSAFLPLLLALPAVLGRWPGRVVLLLSIVFATIDVRSWQKHWSGEYAEDWRGAIAFVAGHTRPNEHIVFVANEGEMLFDYYARTSDYRPSPYLIGAPTSFFANDPPRTMTRVVSDADINGLRQAIAGSSTARWTLIESHGNWADPEHRVLKLLSEHFTLRESAEFTQVMVYQFDPYSGELPNNHPNSR